MRSPHFLAVTLLGTLSLMGLAGAPAKADKLDDILSAGQIRCAVTLDFPPMGSRDANGAPTGFDVDYCHDLADALGVAPVIVETPFPDRLPALAADRADVAIASTSDTLERARTFGFSIPYFLFSTVGLARKEAGLSGPTDFGAHRVGGTEGTYESGWLEEALKKADPAAEFLTFRTQSEVIKALAAGQIDLTWLTSSVATVVLNTPEGAELQIVGQAPVDPDYASIAVMRKEQGMLNYLNLFINHQVRSGRYRELYVKWYGTDAGDPPDIDVPGVYR